MRMLKALIAAAAILVPTATSAKEAKQENSIEIFYMDLTVITASDDYEYHVELPLPVGFPIDFQISRSTGYRQHVEDASGQALGTVLSNVDVGLSGTVRVKNTAQGPAITYSFTDHDGAHLEADEVDGAAVNRPVVPVTLVEGKGVPYTGVLTIESDNGKTYRIELTRHSVS